MSSKPLSQSPVVTISVTFSQDEALAYAQFLKRVGYSDYRANADTHNGDGEVYKMIAAGEQIRSALGDAGFWPR